MKRLPSLCDAKSLIFLITSRAQNYYGPIFIRLILLCADDGLFEVVAGLQACCSSFPAQSETSRFVFCIQLRCCSYRGDILFDKFIKLKAGCLIEPMFIYSGNLKHVCLTVEWKIHFPEQIRSADSPGGRAAALSHRWGFNLFAFDFHYENKQ